MTIYTATPALTETLAGTDPAAVGAYRDRSELVADAAHLIDGTINRFNDTLIGEQAAAERAHAGLLLGMDEAESLGRIAQAAELSGARVALAAETIGGAIETAGQDTVSALDQIAVRLALLTDALDAHRVAILEGGRDLRAEVENLTETVHAGNERTAEVGVALDQLTDVVSDLADLAEPPRGPVGVPEVAVAATKTAVLFFAASVVTSVYGARWGLPSGLPRAAAVLSGVVLAIGVLLTLVPLAVALLRTRGNGHQADVGLLAESSATAVTSHYPVYAEPDFSNDAIRQYWIDRAIAGDEDAQFDIEVAFLQAGYRLDLAERRAELTGA